MAIRLGKGLKIPDGRKFRSQLNTPPIFADCSIFRRVPVQPARCFHPARIKASSILFCYDGNTRVSFSSNLKDFSMRSLAWALERFAKKVSHESQASEE